MDLHKHIKIIESAVVIKSGWQSTKFFHFPPGDLKFESRGILFKAVDQHIKANPGQRGPRPRRIRTGDKNAGQSPI